MNWFSIGKVTAKIKRAFSFSDLTPLGSTFKHRWCYKFKHEFRHTGVLNIFSEVLSQSCTWDPRRGSISSTQTQPNYPTPYNGKQSTSRKKYANAHHHHRQHHHNHNHHLITNSSTVCQSPQRISSTDSTSYMHM